MPPARWGLDHLSGFGGPGNATVTTGWSPGGGRRGAAAAAAAGGTSTVTCHGGGEAALEVQVTVRPGSWWCHGDELELERSRRLPGGQWSRFLVTDVWTVTGDRVDDEA